MAERVQFTVDVNGNISAIEKSIQQVQQSLNKLNIPPTLGSSLNKTFSKLENEIQNFKNISSKGFSNASDINKAQRSYDRLLELFNELSDKSKRVAGIDLSKLVPPGLKSNVDSLNKSWANLNKTIQSKKESPELKEVNKQLTEQLRLQKAIQRETEWQESRQTKLNKISKSIEQQETIKNDPNSTDKQREDATARIEQLKNQQDQINQKIINGTANLEKYQNQLNNLKFSNVEELSDSIDKLTQKWKELSDNSAEITKFKEAFAQIAQTDVSKLPDDLNELQQLVNSFNDEQLKDLKQILENVKETCGELPSSLKPVENAIRDTSDTVHELSEKEKEVESLKQKFLQFFSLTNSVYLFRNAIRSAISTVKELDATMTETAVVTDFTVSDMWDQLPDYTKRANELGVATNDAYAAATLYYQQGLKTNEVIGVSTQTLKMARIAGLDAATATDYMTAALRGFNMEVNETSAERVSDVYSKLAAITASNTQEISVAMTKVASLANNANMEFETTAAFLAQIIETTRESAETAGTALKTVVARFSEVKKLYNSGDLLGTDEEGEGIDVNKVATALRSAGINMNEYFTGAKGLDQIFMELAQKWDTLDTVQQRYIATTAAGSRQQSRFIAMMSDYKRTMELVDAANNSAGASNEQFEKTLDSLDAKLKQLKNAWDEFTMNLANNEAIKLVVDTLTTLLNALNKIVSVLPGVTKSFGSLALTFTGIKSVRAIFNGFTATLGKNGSTGAKVYAEAFAKEFKNKESVLSSLFSKIFSVEITKEAKTVGIFNTTIAQGTKVVKLFGGAITLSLWQVAAFAAGIALLIHVFQQLHKISKSNTLEGKLEKAKEETEKLKNAAEDANSEYENLKNTLGDLKDQQKNIEGLVEGTKEWKEAVDALNQSMLEAIRNNPELGQYVSRNESGQLELDEQAYNGYLTGKQKTAEAAQMVADASELAVSQLELEKAYNYMKKESFLKGNNSYTIGTSQVYLSDEQQLQLARDVQSGKFYQNDYNIYELLGIGNADVTEGAIENFKIQVDNTKTALIAFASGVIQAENDVKTATKNLTLDSIEQINTETYTASQLGLFNAISNNIANSEIVKDYQDKILESDELLNNWANKYAQILGGSYDSETKTLTYTDSDGKTQYLEGTELNTKVSTYGASEWLKTSLNNLVTELDEETSELLKGYINGTSTIDEIDQLKAKAAEISNNDDDPELIKAIFQTKNIEAALDYYRDSINAYKKELSGINDDVLNKLGTTTLSRLNSQTQEMAEGSKEQYLESFNDLAFNLDEEQLKQFSLIASSIDWSNIQSVTSGYEDLLSLNLDPKLLENFWNAGINGAAQQITEIEDLNTLMNSYNSQASKIEEQKALWTGDGISQTEMQKLIDSNIFNASDFIQNDSGNYNVNQDAIDRYSDMIYGKLDEYLSLVLGQTFSEEEANKLAEQLKMTSAGNLDYTGNLLLNSGVSAETMSNAVTAAGATKEETLISQSLASQGKDVSVLDRQIKALAIDYKKLSTQQQGFIDSLDDIKSSLDGAKKGTVQYNNAIKQFGIALNKAFNVDLNDDFYLKHSELVEKVLNGEEDAWADLSNLVAKEITGVAQDLNALSNFIPEIGITTSYNGSAVAQAIAGLDKVNGEIIATDENLQKIQELYGLLGGSITFTYKKMYKDPTSGALVNSPFDGAEQVQVVDQVIVTSNGNPMSNYTPSSSGSGGGGSSKNWENPYDELYNLTQKVNESLRQREKLERQYDLILKNRSKTTKDVYDNMQKQLSMLEEEKRLQEQMRDGKIQQAYNYMSDNANMNKYGRLLINDDGTIRMEIDWNLINGVTDEDTGKEIEEYIKKLEEIEGDIEDAIDGIDDVEDRVLEIYELGKSEYFSFEDQIKDAVINARQSEIDELTAINESINETNSKLIDSMQKSISKMRQDRQNEKTESELSDKQQKILYMSQDTSGGNLTDILKLQKEFDDAQENYTDTLIDQKITELQDQNDAAAEQRERQIKIMESQLDYYEKSGQVWTDVYALLTDGIGENGTLITNSKLMEVLQSSENFKGLSELGKVKWLEELETNVKLALNYLGVGRSTEALLATGAIAEGQNISFDYNGKTITGTVGKNGIVTDANGNTYNGVYQNWDGSWAYSGKLVSQSSGSSPNITSSSSNTANASSNQSSSGSSISKEEEAVSKAVENTQNAATNFANALGELKIKKGQSSGAGGYVYTKYATGGVADYTGPAWLDGTPSKPELVLNQKDTQNFIALKDILASLMAKPIGDSSENGGDNYFDVDINVEKVDSDYSVDQIADRIKTLIRQDATYRNVNVASRAR